MKLSSKERKLSLALTKIARKYHPGSIILVKGKGPYNVYMRRLNGGNIGVQYVTKTFDKEFLSQFNVMLKIFRKNTG